MLPIIAVLLPSKILEGILVVILGGLFGWILGKLPRTWVYVIMAIAIILVFLLLGS